MAGDRTNLEHSGVRAFSAKDRTAWRNWLAKNHAKKTSVWLIIYRKGSGTPSVTYDEAVDEALCFGWIDSKPNKRDNESYYQFFAKRSAKSNWSKINKEKVARLQKAGLMTDSGLAMVELAKRAGTWIALDDVENLVVPGDLRAMFKKNASAEKKFDAFPRSVKKGILEWILSAKKTETRQKRIEETVTLAAKNIRANQYRQ